MDYNQFSDFNVQSAFPYVFFSVRWILTLNWELESIRNVRSEFKKIVESCKGKNWNETECAPIQIRALSIVPMVLTHFPENSAEMMNYFDMCLCVCREYFRRSYKNWNMSQGCRKRLRCHKLFHSFTHQRNGRKCKENPRRRKNRGHWWWVAT